MFENITKFFKRLIKAESQEASSKETAKERLHLVLMQDRANVSADFLEMMKQEIIEVIKKYIDVDENAIDVRLTNQSNDDGTNGAPALYANIPILNIKNDVKGEKMKEAATEKSKEPEEVKNDDKDESNEKKDNEVEVKEGKKDQLEQKEESAVEEIADEKKKYEKENKENDNSSEE